MYTYDGHSQAQSTVFKVLGEVQFVEHEADDSQAHVVAFKVFPPEHVIDGHSQAQVEAFWTVFGAVQVFAGHSHAQVVEFKVLGEVQVVEHEADDSQAQVDEFKVYPAEQV